MRVCLVHNRYGVRAGEEAAVETIRWALTASGHEVSLFLRSTDDLLRGRFGKLRAFASGIWNAGVAREFADWLSETRPDIIQVQNVYPAISPAVLDVARIAGVPLVMRCSNYRLFCPTGLLMSKKTCEMCERCVGGSEYWCVLKNCEASLGKSVGYALRTAYHRARGTIANNVSAYYCPSVFLKSKLVAWGMPEEKMAVIPTPVRDITYVPKPAGSGQYVAYVGRVSPEKGIDWLLNVAMRLRTTPFKIAGRISEHCSHMMARLPANVAYVGELAGEDLDQFYSEARIVVVPSICYEVFPNVALEAMIRARPVIGARIGGIPEIVEDEDTGLLVTPRNVDELAEKLAALWADGDACDRMGDAGRAKALDAYSEEEFCARLVSLYGRVCRRSPDRRSVSKRTSRTRYAGGDLMLRGGIIGFGRMGITHFSILNSRPDVRMVAICDTHAFVRKNAEEYLDVKAFDDYRKMLDEAELDFVIVATPTAAHRETVECALRHKLHVFVEKPFTLNPAEGRELVLAAQEAGVVNQVGYVVRFNDVFMQVKKLLASKALGELISFKMEMSGPTVLRDAKGSWRSKSDTGGGCLYDFASHAVDLINYLIGAPDKISGTILQPIHSVHVEDALSTTYFYRSGLWGNLMVNWSDASYRKPAYRLEVVGRKGKIIADMHAYRIFFRYKPAVDGFTEGWNQRYVTDFVEPVRFYLRGFEFTRQLDYFIDRIQGTSRPGICSFANGLETDVVIARIRENALEEKRSEKWIA